MADVATRALAILRCWRDLGGVKTMTEIPDLVDFAYSHGIAPIQDRSELIDLARLVASLQPARALEIGTARGGTLFLLCRLAAAHATLMSLDLRRGPYGGGYSALRIPLYKRFARRGQALHLIRGDSHSSKALDRVTTILGGELLDYLFIDGDHSYEGVRRDFGAYSPLVKKGGTVVFHDIVPHPGGGSGDVHCFWNELKHQYPFTEIISGGSLGCGVGVLRV